MKKKALAFLSFLVVIALISPMFVTGMVASAQYDGEIIHNRIRIDIQNLPDTAITAGTVAVGTLTIAISAADRDFTIANASVVIELDSPLMFDASDPCGDMLFVKGHEFLDTVPAGAPHRKMRINFEDITPAKLAEWGESSGGTSGMLAVPFKVMFPNLTTTDTAPANVTATFYEGNANLSTDTDNYKINPETGIKEPLVPPDSDKVTPQFATHWKQDKKLCSVTGGISTPITYNKFKLSADGAVYKNASDINYLLTFTNDTPSSIIGKLATNKLDIYDDFYLPVGVTLSNASDIVVTLTDSPDVKFDGTPVISYDAATGHVTINAEVVRSDGSVTLDVPTFKITVKVNNVTLSDQTIIGKLPGTPPVLEPDALPRKGWAIPSNGLYTSSFVNTLHDTTLHYYGGDKGKIKEAEKEVELYFDTGSGGGDYGGYESQMLTKVIDQTNLKRNKYNEIHDPEDFLSGGSLVTYKIGGFGNFSDMDLTDYEIAENYKSTEMYPVSVDLGAYQGYDVTKVIVGVTMSGTEYFAQPGAGVHNFVSMSYKDANGNLATPTIDLTKITKIRFIYASTAGFATAVNNNNPFPTVVPTGTDASRFKNTSPILLTFQPVRPAALSSEKTINNEAALSYKYSTYPRGVDADASYKIVPKGTASIFKGKYASAPAGKNIYEPGDVVTYTVMFSVPAGQTLVNPVITDYLDAANVDTTVGVSGITSHGANSGQYKSGYDSSLVTAGPLFPAGYDTNVLKSGVNPNPSVTLANGKIKSVWSLGTINGGTAGITVLIRYDVKIAAGAANGAKILNDFVLSADSIGPTGGSVTTSDPSWSGGSTIVVGAGVPQFAIQKTANKPYAPSPSKHPGDNTGNTFVNVFDANQGTTPITNDNLSLTNRIAKYDVDSDGNCTATFTIFVRNTSATPISAQYLYIDDRLLIDTDVTGFYTNGDERYIEKYIQKDSSNKAKITNMTVKHYNLDGTTNYDGASSAIPVTVDLAAFPTVRGAGHIADTLAATSTATDYKLRWRVNFGTTNEFAKDDQLQIQYTIALKNGAGKSVALRNDARLSYITDPTGSGVSSPFLAEVVDPYRTGASYNPGYTSSGDIPYLRGSARISLKIGDSRVGIKKSLRYTDAVPLQSAEKSIVFLRQGKTKFVYEVHVKNESQAAIAAGAWTVYDRLPEYQVAMKSSTEQAADGTLVIYGGCADDGTLSSSQTLATSDLIVTTDHRQLWKFQNPAELKPGQEWVFYIRTSIPETGNAGETRSDAILAAASAPNGYLPVQNDVALQVAAVGMDNYYYYDGSQTIGATSQSGFHGQSGFFMTSLATEVYHPDYIIPSIVKGSGNSHGVAIAGQAIDYTITVRNYSEQMAMSEFTVTDLIEHRILTGADLLSSIEITKKTGDAAAVDIKSQVQITLPEARTHDYSRIDYDKITFAFPAAITVTDKDVITIKFRARPMASVTPLNNHAFLMPKQKFFSTHLNTSAKGTYIPANYDYAADTTTLKDSIDNFKLADFLPLVKAAADPGLWSVTQITTSDIPGLILAKGIKLPQDTRYLYNNGNPDSAFVTQIPGRKVDYQLELKNTSTDTYTDLKFLDVLPHLHDTGIFVTGDSRSSEFAIDKIDTGSIKITKIDAAGVSTNVTFTPTYSTHKTTDPDRWNDGHAAYATGDNTMKLVLDNTLTVAKDEQIIINFSAILPLPKVTTSKNDPTNKELDGLKAWNTFAVDVTYNGGNKTGKFEPLRVGVAMRTGSVTVIKSVTGGASPAGFEFTLTDPNNNETVTGVADAAGLVFFGNLVEQTVYTLTESDKSGYTFKNWKIPAEIATKSIKFVLTDEAAPNYPADVHVFNVANGRNLQIAAENSPTSRTTTDTPPPGGKDPTTPPTTTGGGKEDDDKKGGGGDGDDDDDDTTTTTTPPTKSGGQEDDGDDGGTPTTHYPKPPTTPIDVTTIDRANPPRWSEPIDESLIPQGWRQVHAVDENGEEYWTLEEIPLSGFDEDTVAETMPKAGGAALAIAGLAGAGLIAGGFMMRPKRRK